MIYLGAEYKFRFSVGAQIEIAKLCPDGDITKLRETLTGDPERMYKMAAKMATAMNRAYIINERFESGVPMKDWEPIEPMPEELVMNMDPDQFRELFNELIATYSGQGKQTQSVESAQKKIVNINEQQA